MAETPKKKLKQSSKYNQQYFVSPNSTPVPATPNTLDPTPVRRSSRLHASSKTTTRQELTLSPPVFSPSPTSCRVPSRRKSLNFTTGKGKGDVEKSPNYIPPISPDRTETRRKRKLSEDKNSGLANNRGSKGPKKRVYYKKVIYDGGEFSVGDDVYVKRREDASSDNDDPVVEECVICFEAGRAVMIECDDCLGGFHLKCLKPPLLKVPEGDWVCQYCEAKKLGKNIALPTPPNGKKRARTARDKLLSSDLWAARIERCVF